MARYLAFESVDLASHSEPAVAAGTPAAASPAKHDLHGSRVVCALNHSLRQPLQTMALLHSVLRQQLAGSPSLGLVDKLDRTIDAISEILNAALGIARGVAADELPEVTRFPINFILNQLRTEFTPLTKARGVSLQVVSSGLSVRSDPRLLSQMMRVLLSDAIGSSRRQRLLLGCRRSAGKVRLELWDGGIEQSAEQLEMRFEESIRAHSVPFNDLPFDPGYAHRIGKLLGHTIEARSNAGRKAVFSVEIPMADGGNSGKGETAPQEEAKVPDTFIGTLLIIEDDCNVRESLELSLQSFGYRTIAASGAADVSDLLRRSALNPDLIVADYSLADGKTSLEIIRRLRATLGREVPSIVLSGGLTASTLEMVTAAGCEYCHKPVDNEQLVHRIETLLRAAVPSPISTVRKPASRPNRPAAFTVFVVDDDPAVRASMRDMLLLNGYAVELHADASSFLSSYQPRRKGCLLIDAMMPDIDGLELLQRLKHAHWDIPSIMMTGYGDVGMATRAMKAGAMDFLEKPVKSDVLLECIDSASVQSTVAAERSGTRARAAARVGTLTPRMREVMTLVVDGQSNKEIAAKLKINQRTVEAHRATIMQRTGATSLADLVRLAIQAMER